MAPVHCRKKRRGRFALLMLIELVAQWINCAFFIIPNVALLARPCDYFSKLVRELPQQAYLAFCRLAGCRSIAAPKSAACSDSCPAWRQKTPQTLASY